MSYQWDFSIVARYTPLFLSGLGFTVLFTVVTIALGLAIGVLAGSLRLFRNPLVAWPLGIYVGLFRCTPLLVLIVWVYYALPVLIGVALTPVFAGGLVLSLYVGAFYAEIFRGGVQAIPAGQWDAAWALGMRTPHALRLVILPQAFRQMVPPLINQSITQWKNTALVSVIAVPDLLYQGTLVAGETFRPLEVYTVIAAIYLAVLLPLTFGAEALERRRKGVRPVMLG